MVTEPKLFSFPAYIQLGQNGSYLVFFKDLPEAITFGVTEEKAKLAAEDCLKTALLSRIKDNEDIPESSPSNEETFTVTVEYPLISASELAALVGVKPNLIGIWKQRGLVRRKIGATGIRHYGVDAVADAKALVNTANARQKAGGIKGNIQRWKDKGK